MSETMPQEFVAGAVWRAIIAERTKERERLARLVETQEVRYHAVDDKSQPDIAGTLSDLARRIRAEP